jgi:hypothetical protein
MVNFDINEINDPEGVVFIEPKNTESLNGFFIQDKVKLFDGKLNFLLGIKAETYSLVNDDYYLSPMAKVSIIPFENLTIWGGYTQSYTTPGYNTTNIDLLILRTLSDETISGLAYQGVYDAVYDPTYAGNIAGGATPAQAAAAATAAAESFVASPTGLATITGTEQAIRNGAPNNTGVINGSETKPTKYQTWEVGFRSNIENTLSLESNFYYTTISDGVRPSSNTITTNSASLHNEGVFADYYAYGNYIKGTIYGVESTIRIIPAKGTKIEVSHVFTKSAWERSISS